jgi:hypothetical protein
MKRIVSAVLFVLMICVEVLSPVQAFAAFEVPDLMYEMARDEARHGRGLEGLLKRYFK